MKIAALGAVLLAVVAAIVVPTFLLVRDAEPHRPTLTAYAGGTSIRVEPYRYCTVNLEDCVDGGSARLEVRPDEPLQVSLPAEIADAPLWRLLMVYEGADGQPVERLQYFTRRGAEPQPLRDGGEPSLDGLNGIPGRSSLTIQWPERPHLQLAGIEISLPSAVVDQEGNPFVHATWSIKTT